MALVGQEPVLFHGTIAENILLGTCGKTMEDVRNACKMANAQAFIEAAPMVGVSLYGFKFWYINC